MTNSGVIKILPESLSNQIAAGEVIDRPASAIKELLENSIDAGATQIRIIVRDGGKTLMQVVDNGAGMSESDAILAFERHSTSKIKSAEDLSRIITMGFRGEALASIGSVARVEMKTLIHGESAATQLLLEGGLVREITKAAGNTGTSIAIKNIFFNTPARRKFLKSDPAEYRHILQVAKRYFLSFPEIEFRFFKNDEEIYHLPSADLSQRIGQVFGEKHEHNIVPVSFESARSQISGFVGNLDLFRQSRGDQYLFLNRRYIQNKTLNWATVSAYEQMLPKGSYPFYVLNLELDPESIDVNVHPSKVEVRFEDERLVYGLVHRAVKNALQSKEVVPTLRSQSSGNDVEYETVPMSALTGGSGGTGGKNPTRSSTTDLLFPFEFRNARRELAPEQHSGEITRDEPGASPELRIDPSERVSVWQLHNKYLFSQIKSGLIIIDQHLAHERILYEKALALFKKARPVAQQQLFPETVELGPDDFDVLLEMQFYLSRLGFVVKEFGKNTVVIEAVPAEMRRRDDENVLREMIDDYKSNKEPDIRERIATTYSCKNAIKAGDPLKQDEIVSLIDNLFATQNPYFCPHGRPVIITMPLEELDRRFLRI